MIRHWSGYGHVYAKKLDVLKGTLGKTSSITLVKITGNHEMGLERPFNDPICIKEWLGRFIPDGDTFRFYDVIDSGFENREGIDMEYAIYRLVSDREA